MIWIAALQLLASAPEKAGRDAIDLFIDGCVKGVLRLPPGSAKQRMLLNRYNDYGHKGRDRIVEIYKPVRATMTVREYDAPKRSGIESTCKVQSPSIDYVDAVRRLRRVLFPGAADIPIRYTQMVYEDYVPLYRYRVQVSRAEFNGVVMMTTILEESAASAEAEKQQKRFEELRAKSNR